MSIKKELIAAGIVLAITFVICLKIRANSDHNIKAALETVQSQNEALKTELHDIKALLQTRN